MTSQDTDTTGLDDVLQIDIVSDVVCPWCIVGFKQLEQAIARTGVTAAIKWHPFELNQDMAAEGENLREHIMRKYGSNAEQSQAARDRLIPREAACAPWYHSGAFSKEECIRVHKQGPRTGA